MGSDSGSRRTLRKLLYSWGPVVLCMAAIFFLSAQPKLPDIPFLNIIVINGEDYSDKLKHVIAYAVLGALIWRALSRRSPRWWQIAATVALATAYGLTDESHQIYVPGRSFDLLDLGADALGSAAAAAALTIWKGGVTLGERRRSGEEVRGKGQEAG